MVTSTTQTLSLLAPTHKVVGCMINADFASSPDARASFAAAALQMIGGRL